MAKKMNVLIVSSEVTPWAKAGGLADVTAALAIHLAEIGHRVVTVIPAYRCVRTRLNGAPSQSMCVHMGEGEEWCGVESYEIAPRCTVVCIDHAYFFDREGLYHDNRMNDYTDNPRRFGFFCRAALQYCLDYGFSPDIVHANEWQTALVPAYLKTWFWDTKQLGHSASVLTIHNVAYQGTYPAADYPWLGLRKEDFIDTVFEDYGKVNFLKGGIHFSDVVNTVSPSYAREITTPYHFNGLAPALSAKGDRFSGILNGVDYDHWSPESDTLIPARYSASRMAGKNRCKQELQRTFLLHEDREVMLIGAVGRFVEQKGYHLVQDMIDRLMRTMAVQFVILGSGEESLEWFFGGLPRRYPGRVGAYIGYDNERAHLIEAGADAFLMPSLFEPCGLNQLYSLRYGTLPIVRATGGLEDTVDQYDETTGGGTGFKFNDPTSTALYDTIGWAVSTWYDRRRHYRAMQKRAMQHNFSWDTAIVQYERLYAQARTAKRSWDAMHR